MHNRCPPLLHSLYLKAAPASLNPLLRASTCLMPPPSGWPGARRRRWTRRPACCCRLQGRRWPPQVSESSAAQTTAAAARAAETGAAVPPAHAPALLVAGNGLFGSNAAAATGTYVGCMFLDYASLLRAGLQQQPSGPVMTGERRRGGWGGGAGGSHAIFFPAAAPLPSSLIAVGLPPASLLASAVPLSQHADRFRFLQATALLTRAGGWPMPSISG
jgi:hypothetical protein